MEELHIWRLAKEMIEVHGDKAPLTAVVRMDKYRAEGNLAEVRLWARILATIGRLSHEDPDATNVFD